ncbi:hypothetical protein Y1Q_0001561 [Alligator mississippiensis]|uniref:Uncharacterized protein n=1 Tax=Alligator mississippiensis TaxID=8496 RepID=A0A151M9W9_ALLMI|nr:hypothetical protein Y1Q_0001561 [Alligator mississippiensis]
MYSGTLLDEQLLESTEDWTRRPRSASPELFLNYFIHNFDFMRPTGTSRRNKNVFVKANLNSKDNHSRSGTIIFRAEPEDLGTWKCHGFRLALRTHAFMNIQLIQTTQAASYPASGNSERTIKA